MSAILNKRESGKAGTIDNDAGSYLGGFYLNQAPGDGVGVTVRDVLLNEIDLLAGPTTVRLPLLLAYVRGHIDSSSIQVFGVSLPGTPAFRGDYETDLTREEIISEIDSQTIDDIQKLQFVVDILKNRVNKSTVAV